MNLQIEVLTLHVRDLELDWIDLRPGVFRVHHDVWVSLGDFFVEPFFRLGQDFTGPAIVDSFGSTDCLFDLTAAQEDTEGDT